MPRGMPSPKQVRITLRGTPTAEQLQVLRRELPALSVLPPAELRRHLIEWPICVVGECGPARELHLVQQLQSSGIDVELISFEDYSAEYLRSILPRVPEPAWSVAAASVEVVFRPAFTPEVILRLWSDGAAAGLQLATLQASISLRRFYLPPWLRSDDDEVAPEQAWSETAPVAERDALFAPLHALPGLPPAAMAVLDGMSVDVISRRGSDVVSRTYWLPDAQRAPDVHHVLEGLLIGASGALRDPRSQVRLSELRQQLG